MELRKALVFGLSLGVGAVAFVSVKSLVAGYFQARAETSDEIISGATRVEFVRAANESCLKNQRSSRENTGVSDGIIVKYCACIAERSADRTPLRDLRTFKGAVTPEIQARVNSIADVCIQEAVKQ